MSAPTIHVPRYRVWDGRTMRVVDELRWSMAGLIWQSLDHAGGWVQLNPAYWHHAENGKPREWPRLDTLMEWTGLRDCLGRDIYGSDIVRVNSHLRVIERRAGHWACNWSDYHLGTCWFMGGAPEVMGNVYEHPDLLKEAVRP